MLLGQDEGTQINVANSFAVPFEEDERDGKTWFLDHDYIEFMTGMFKKVNGECDAKEKLRVGGLEGWPADFSYLFSMQLERRSWDGITQGLVCARQISRSTR